MRERLFKGIRVDNGEWVEGGVYYQKADDVKEEAVYIIGGSLNDVGCAYQVIPESVGESTCPRYNLGINDAVYRPSIYDTGILGDFIGKNIYAFYSPFTNHDNKDDAAVVAAVSKEEAISKLRKYYANASEDNVREVEFNRDDICIICDTY